MLMTILVWSVTLVIVLATVFRMADKFLQLKSSGRYVFAALVYASTIALAFVMLITAGYVLYSAKPVEAVRDNAGVIEVKDTARRAVEEDDRRPVRTAQEIIDDAREQQNSAESAERARQQQNVDDVYDDVNAARCRAGLCK